MREAAGWSEGTAVGRQAVEIAAGGRGNSTGYVEKEENVYYPDASGISM